MFVRSLLPRLGPQEGAGQVTQKAYGVETLPTATGPHSPSWLGIWAERRKELTFIEFTPTVCLTLSILWHQTDWIQILTPPCICSVALGKFLNLSVPKIHHL